MKYAIKFEKRARRFIYSLSKTQREYILNAIKKLPNQGDIKQLIGHEGVFRLRIGVYRVIFTKNDEILLIKVIDVGKRGSIYRDW